MLLRMKDGEDRMVEADRLMRRSAHVPRLLPSSTLRQALTSWLFTSIALGGVGRGGGVWFHFATE